MADIIRRPLGADTPSSSEVWIEPDPETTGKILGFFGRVNDRAQIRNAIKNRYGTGIQEVKDDNGTTSERYTKKGFTERMQAGHIETVSVGLGHSITGANATLFTEPGLKFSLVGPSEETDVTDASEFLADFREASQAIDGLVQVDRESVQVGAGILWLDFYEDKIRYRTVDPGKIHVRYDQTVLSRGNPRPVDYQNLEDATCIILETGTIDDTKKAYLAIFGRSVEYPQGRYVTYLGEGDGKDVPDVGDEGADDWAPLGGEAPANPMSVYALENPELDVPDYPLAIFYGGHVRRDRLFPVSTSLLEESLEADVSASHIRATSGDHARGTLAVHKAVNGAAAPLPRNLRGDVSLEPGQKLEAVDGNAAAGEIAWKILKEQNVASAQGFYVPDFYISSEDHTLEASSGIALKVRAGPLVKFRDERVAINRPGVDKVFRIEKALIGSFLDDPAVETLKQCSQNWDPGPLDYPEDEKVLVDNVERLVKLGIYDTIEAIQVIFQLPSEQDAIEKYEALKARAEKYPPLNDKPELEMMPGQPAGPFGTTPDQ